MTKLLTTTAADFDVYVNKEPDIIPGMVVDGPPTRDGEQTCEVCCREGVRTFVLGPPPLRTCICDGCCQALGQVVFPMRTI